MLNKRNLKNAIWVKKIPIFDQKAQCLNSLIYR